MKKSKLLILPGLALLIAAGLVLIFSVANTLPAQAESVGQPTAPAATTVAPTATPVPPTATPVPPSPTPSTGPGSNAKKDEGPPAIIVLAGVFLLGIVLAVAVPIFRNRRG